MSETETWSALHESVSAELMMENLEVIAGFQKYSGTPSELESLGILRGKLESFGFEVRTLFHEAYISIPGASSVEADSATLKSITHSFGQPSEPDGLTAPLVYCGRGAPGDFAGVDVAGKIALLDGIANPVASSNASRAGAAGQLHVSPHMLLHEMCISPVWGNPSAETLGQLPSTVVCSISNEDGTRLKQGLAEGREIVATLNAEVETGWRDTPILIADMTAPDSGPAEPFVLFSGHHDTWYEGVMDNGAANILILEVARLCALKQADWKRNLRVAIWSGHSHGRYSGSTWYADNHWDELNRRCVAHVNVDSSGGRNSLVLDNAESMSMLRTLTADCIRAETGVEIKGKRMARAGDQSFGGIGLPAMLMGFSQQDAGFDEATIDGKVVKIDRTLPVGLGWWWHTPYDLIGNIDPELQSRDTRVYVRILAKLLGQEFLPLDFRPVAAELLVLLEEIQASLGERFDLSDVIAKVRDFEKSARRVAGIAAPADAMNRALMKASRAIVSIEYTAAGRFAHDPALPIVPYPCLQPLRDLAAETDSDRAKFIAVDARRACNCLISALSDAVDALDI